jgi:two-component system, cell cycle sensor histidine kinase DivJ
VTNQITILSKLSNALTRFCESWLSGASLDGRIKVQHQRLTAYLFAIPFVGLMNAATNPVAFSQSTNALSLSVLAFAIPFTLVGALSRFNTEIARKVITIAVAPIALLLITQGHLNTLAVAGVLLAILGHEASRKRFERAQLGISAVVTLSLASIFSAAYCSTLVELSTFIGFLPAVFAGVAYVMFEARPLPVADEEPKHKPFEIASLITNVTKATVLQIDSKARVAAISSNVFDVLQLEKTDLSDASFLDRVHIADKVVLLSHVDAVANGKGSAQFNIRLNVGGTPSKRTNSWMQTSCSVFEIADCLMLVLEARMQPISEAAEHSGSIGTAALTIVSHEMRTPLNAILGFSDLMSKGLAGDIANDRQREYIALINQSGKHLLELVNSILDLSKLENGTFELEAEQFLPEQAAEFAISMLAIQASDKQIGLDYLPLCGLEEFSGDKRVAQQIMINLLSNAVKFTPNHGQISLKLEMDGARLIIEITDTGIGMSQDELSRVGTPFYQASNSHSRLQEGAGLGLSLVRQLASLHGGAMELTSAHGKGTSARVALAALGRKKEVVSYLKHKEVDESVRFIQVEEELNYGPSRKTA